LQLAPVPIEVPMNVVNPVLLGEKYLPAAPYTVKVPLLVDFTVDGVIESIVGASTISVNVAVLDDDPQTAFSVDTGFLFLGNVEPAKIIPVGEPAELDCQYVSWPPKESEVSVLVEVTVTVVADAQELEAISTVPPTTKLPLGPCTVYVLLLQATLCGTGMLMVITAETTTLSV
jgi:hypothetical protein